MNNIGASTTIHASSVTTKHHKSLYKIRDLRPITRSLAERSACNGYIPGRVTITRASNVLVIRYKDKTTRVIAKKNTTIESNGFSRIPVVPAVVYIITEIANGTSWTRKRRKSKKVATIGEPALYRPSRSFGLLPASCARNNHTVTSHVSNPMMTA